MECGWTETEDSEGRAIIAHQRTRLDIDGSNVSPTTVDPRVDGEK